MRNRTSLRLLLFSMLNIQLEILCFQIVVTKQSFALFCNNIVNTIPVRLTLQQLE